MSAMILKVAPEDKSEMGSIKLAWQQICSKQPGFVCSHQVLSSSVISGAVQCLMIENYINIYSSVFLTGCLNAVEVEVPFSH